MFSVLVVVVAGLVDDDDDDESGETLCFCCYSLFSLLSRFFLLCVCLRGGSGWLAGFYVDSSSW